MKRFLFLLPILFVLEILSSSRKLRPGVSFCNVGQGDAAVIITDGGQVVLSDCGPDGQVMLCLGRRLRFWRKKIDAIIISHPHSDHFAGCLQVLKHYQVGKIFLGLGDVPDGGYYQFLAAAKDSRADIVYVDNNKSLHFSSHCHLGFLLPSYRGDDMNEYSLGFRLDCLGISLLSLGDLGPIGEKELLSGNHDLSVNIFKVSHHGSASSNLSEFLMAVCPGLAVISVGAGNSYGHPAADALFRLRASGAIIWRTDQQGGLNIFF